MTYLWDFFSLLPFYLIFVIIPGILFIQSFFPNVNFTKGVLFLTFSVGGLIVLTFILFLLTHFVFLLSEKWNLSWFKRPNKADNCSYLNDNSDKNDKFYNIGLPSHHAAIATYAFLVVGLIFIDVPFISHFLILILFIGWLFTLASRIMKNCENLLQVIIGIIIGLLYFFKIHLRFIHKFLPDSLPINVLPYTVRLPIILSFPFIIL